ncbi:adenine phosphoribosyltransferase [Paraliomyxa miuraensis]|uniref:adenine phosphoribosyltransferase n=1 Tax=Paraliomyxa miuraensis TaxID=376150 RepID=UPI0022525CC7|nr:adenine phosphoribosyltransferase [Paraliomyxa miuraensis]MCX4244533.1 adenine phosphoribosyltransferase [Paraliomyxa miuraensis]
MSDPFDPQAALERVRAKIRSVPDFPKPGILFRDITPVLAHPPTLVEALRLHRQHVADLEGRIDKIVGMESRGFLFGMALAAELHVGFVPARKPGKLPAATTEVRYALEYGEDALQIHTDAIDAGDRVLVVDDLLATGGTAAAACQLVTKLGGTVLAALFLIELQGLDGRAKLDGLRVETLLRY